MKWNFRVPTLWKLGWNINKLNVKRKKGSDMPIRENFNVLYEIAFAIKWKALYVIYMEIINKLKEMLCKITQFFKILFNNIVD